MTNPTDLSRYSALETLRNGRVIEIRAIKPENRYGVLKVIDRASIWITGTNETTTEYFGRRSAKTGNCL